MTLAEIEKVWHSDHNAPSREQMNEHHERFVATIRKRRRTALMDLAFLALVLALLFGSLLQFIGSGGAFDAKREWASLLFLTLPVLVLLLVARRYLDHVRRYENYTSSIAQSLRAFLDETRLQLWRLQVAMLGFTGGMLLLPVITAQLQDVGKQRPNESLSMIVLFGIAYVVSMAVMYMKWRRLRSELPRLTQLVAEIDG